MTQQDNQKLAEDLVKSLGLPESENEKIFSGNLSRILDLS